MTTWFASRFFCGCALSAPPSEAVAVLVSLLQAVKRQNSPAEATKKNFFHKKMFG
jgi:hypothetical protein